MQKFKTFFIAAVGAVTTSTKPIIAMIDRLAEIDFMHTYLGVAGDFLATGWGTLVTVLGGMWLIAWAILLKESKIKIRITSVSSRQKIELRQKICGTVTPSGLAINVFVHSGDGLWYLQKKADVKGNKWSANCQFGDEQRGSGDRFIIIATDYVPTNCKPNANLPYSENESDPVIVLRE
ncbi:MAG TPA: hypothetical protein VME69_00090 [Methylocella sp.]|nr:hypothetical protein [Methylocella sp.]